LGIARLTAIFVNMFLKKGKQPFKPADFMLFHGDAPTRTDKPERKNWRHQLQQVQVINAAFGGKDLRGEK